MRFVNLLQLARAARSDPPPALAPEIDESNELNAAYVEAPPEPAPLVCYWCRGVDFWHGSGVVVCRACHPPAPGAERPAAAADTRTDGAPAAGGAR